MTLLFSLSLLILYPAWIPTDFLSSRLLLCFSLLSLPHLIFLSMCIHKVILFPLSLLRIIFLLLPQLFSHLSHSQFSLCSKCVTSNEKKYSSDSLSVFTDSLSHNDPSIVDMHSLRHTHKYKLMRETQKRGNRWDTRIRVTLFRPSKPLSEESVSHHHHCNHCSKSSGGNECIGEEEGESGEIKKNQIRGNEK